jgi:hypothetical protein
LRSVEIDIGQGERYGFTNAQTRTIEQQKQGAIRDSVYSATVIGETRLRRIQQAFKFGTREYVRHKAVGQLRNALRQ